jgi:hypothetical protein
LRHTKGSLPFVKIEKQKLTKGMKMKNLNLKNVLGMLTIGTLLAACNPETTRNDHAQGMGLKAQSSFLPTLHEIKTHTFEATYENGGSYETSALFITEYAKQRNSPDLLFRGWNDDVSVVASTAGDDFSVISDLGLVSIDSVSALKSFNYENVVGRDNIFKQTMPVKSGRTYVVLSTKRDVRSLWVFQVERLKDGKMQIRYAVKSYSVIEASQESEGFDWNKGNY